MEFKERLKRMFAPHLVLKDFRKMYIDDPDIETYEEKIKAQIALGRAIKTYYASFLSRFRRFEEAEAMFLEAIETEGEKAMGAYAFFLERHGLAEEAIKYYQILVEKKYKLPTIYSLYSFCLSDMCEDEEAAEKALLSYEHGRIESYVDYYRLIQDNLTVEQREKEIEKILSMHKIPDATKGTLLYSFAKSTYFSTASEEYLDICRKYQEVSLKTYYKGKAERLELVSRGLKWMELGRDKYKNINCERYCEICYDPKRNREGEEKYLETAIINYQEKGDTGDRIKIGQK